MMTRITPALLLVAFLPACQPDQAANAADNPAETTATAPPREIEPGLYRQSTTLLAYVDPALSPEEAAAVAKSVGTTQTRQSCLTPERIANPESIIKDSVDAACKVDRLNWKSGTIDVALACPDASRSQAGVLALTGTYNGDAYAMDLKMAGPGGMSAQLKVDAKRVGDC